MDDFTDAAALIGTRDLAPLSPTGLGPRFCPFCRGQDTELLSSFGSQLSTEQHYCRSCRTPFEYMRQEEAASS